MKLKSISLFAMFPVLVACGGSPPSSSATATEGREVAPAWSAHCVASRGCGDAQTLPPCGEAPSAIDLATAQQGAVGSTVTVRAYLTQSPGMMTLMGCAEGDCCNTARASLLLVATPMASLQSPETPSLGLGEGYACMGDDSGLCCTYAVDASAPEVVVTGTLADQQGVLTLEPTSICTL